MKHSTFDEAFVCLRVSKYKIFHTYLVDINNVYWNTVMSRPLCLFPSVMQFSNGRLTMRAKSCLSFEGSPFRRIFRPHLLEEVKMKRVIDESF